MSASYAFPLLRPSKVELTPDGEAALRAAVAYIEAHPQTWDQGIGVSSEKTACIAGHLWAQNYGIDLATADIPWQQWQHVNRVALDILLGDRHARADDAELIGMRLFSYYCVYINGKSYPLRGYGDAETELLLTYQERIDLLKERISRLTGLAL